MTIIWFYSVNVQGNWARLAEKISQTGPKITTMYAIIKIFYLYYHKNILKAFVLLWATKSCGII